MPLDWSQLGDSQRLPAGSYLWHQGESNDGLVYLLEGKVDILELSLNGEMIVFHTAGPGELLGEMSSLDGGAHSATAQIREDCLFRRISRAEFLRQLQEQPEIQQELLLRLTRRVRRLTRQLTRVALEKVKVRVAAELARWPEPVARITHQELAGRIGTTRESATKALGYFARKGWLRLSRGQIEILSHEALLDFSSHTQG